MTFPTLYKPTKTGATQQYTVSTNADTITVSQGQLNGKLQHYLTICTSKNVGRANETSPPKQAELEAQSKWNKKVKEGYTTEVTSGNPLSLPRKVSTYIGNEHKIKFPAFATPKLNGINGTYWLKAGKLTLTSRGGDEYPRIPHLEPQIRAVMRAANTDCLNGELYIHGYHLQDITAAVKKPNELSPELDFCIFDLPTVEGSYKVRRNVLLIITDNLEEDIPNIGILTGNPVRNTLDIERHYNQCMAVGLEGTVIYNADALYVFNTRSTDIFKYKKTKDAEFKVQSFRLDKYAHPIYTCLTPEGLTFKVKRKGTKEERLADASVAPSNIGRWLNVEYEMLSKDLKPLKPVGNNFRECDTNGNPQT